MKVAVISRSPERSLLYRRLMPGHEVISVTPGEFIGQPSQRSWDLVLMDANLQARESDLPLLLSRLKDLDGMVAACPGQGNCLLRQDRHGGIQLRCGHAHPAQNEAHGLRTLIFQDSHTRASGE